MSFKIHLGLSVAPFPRVIVHVPHHANLLQLGDAVLSHPPCGNLATLHLPHPPNPRAQRIAVCADICELRHQMPVFLVVLRCVRIARLPRCIGVMRPHHTDALQALNLSLRELRLVAPLAPEPLAQVQSLRCDEFPLNQQVAMLLIIGSSRLVVEIPRRAQAALQLRKQHHRVPHLLDDSKLLDHNLVIPALAAQALHSLVHLGLNRAIAAQTAKVVNNIEDQRRALRPRCQRAADLLLIDDGRLRLPEQDDTADTPHMHTLVEHIDREQQLEVVAVVLHKRLVCPARLRIGRVRGVDVHLRVDLSEPLFRVAEHTLHVRLSGAEDEILSRPVRHVARKNGGQPLRILHSDTQRIHASLAVPAQRGGTDLINSLLKSFQLPLNLIDCRHIRRRGQNVPHNRLTQRHLAGNAARKQLLRHVPLSVQIADFCRRKAQQQRARIGRQQPRHTAAPALRAAAVELVEDDAKRHKNRNLLVGHHHQAGIGQERDALHREIRRSARHVFDLCMIDVLARGEPDEALACVLLDPLEGDEALARAGGMDDRCFRCFAQHRRHRVVRLTVVRKELHGHLSPSFGGCAANFQIIRSRGKTANKA